MAGLSPRHILLAGALLSGVGVAGGAVGTHALRAMLDPERLGWWRTGVEYQVWHGLALLALSAAPLRRTSTIALLLLAGSLLFSGSLYAMALTGWRWLGMATPVGGVGMLAGWGLLVCSAIRERSG